MPGRTNEDTVRDLVARYELQPHPEGGFYRETYRSPRRLAVAALPGAYDGEDRALVTSIVFLLPTGTRSAWHRVRSEELFVHHAGDPLRLVMHPADQPEQLTTVRLGLDADALQAVVPPGWWQAAEPDEGPHGWSMVGCVVAPGFEFADFEMR